MSNKILLRKSSLLTTSKKIELLDYIEIMKVDFTFVNASIQEANCISEEGLILALKDQKIGALDKEQRKALNELYKYLNKENKDNRQQKIKLDLVDDNERFINHIDDEIIKKYPIFIQDCIYEVLKDSPDIIWQKCSKCNNYYPYHKNFYYQNQHSSAELNTVCRACQKWDHNRSKTNIIHGNNEFNTVFRKYGEEVYLLYKNHNTIAIYEHFVGSDKVNVPSIINNRDDYLIILKYLHINKKLKLDSLLIKDLEQQTKLYFYSCGIKQRDIFDCLFGSRCREYPWEYNIRLTDLTFEEAKNIFNNYIDYKGIKINDIYNFCYWDIIHNCQLESYVSGDTLGFIMQYYNNEHAPYKFQGGYTNYWRNKDNVNFALKYYIEKDKQIPIEKIPLYVTLNSLQQNVNVLYNIIYKKRFHNSLYEWINDIYPDKFIEEDFNIGVIRNKFDSQEEQIIYELLNEQLGNVIYNKRNTDNTVKFDDMIPDYLIFNTNECIIGEYFGLYVPNKKGTNKRIDDYIKKTDNKIEKYKKVNYKKLFLFPSDLENDMEGLKNKIELIR